MSRIPISCVLLLRSTDQHEQAERKESSHRSITMENVRDPSVPILACLSPSGNNYHYDGRKIKTKIKRKSKSLTKITDASLSHAPVVSTTHFLYDYFHDKIGRAPLVVCRISSIPEKGFVNGSFNDCVFR